MLIKYELYRAKNQELFNAEMIKWDLKTDEDIIDIDRRINTVLAQHMCSLPEVKKYGTGYVGRMKIVSVEITDDDYTCELDEELFKKYLSDESVNVQIPIIWSKTTTDTSEEK